MDKYLTFLYIRRGNAGVKSIRIHRTVCFSLLAAFIAIIVTALSMIARYSGIAAESKKNAELKAENLELSSRIDLFNREIEDLKRRMNVNLELQNQARLLAGLETITEDVWQVGVGGPEPGILEDIGMESDLLVSDLERNLDRMVRQSELQLKSYNEIISILDKEKKFRDSTPSIRPLRGGFLSSRFGRRMDPFTGRISRHLGVDYRARSGTPVVSTANGMVTMGKKKGSFGLVVEVNHGNGFKTRYAHLSRILVKRGQRVKRGETIGLVGDSGRSTGSHLHYEVIFRKVNRDPLQYIIPKGIYYD